MAKTAEDIWNKAYPPNLFKANFRLMAIIVIPVLSVVSILRVLEGNILDAIITGSMVPALCFFWKESARPVSR